MKNFLCFVEAANSFNNYSNLFLCKELSDDEVLSFSTKILLNNLFENIFLFFIPYHTIIC